MLQGPIFLPNFANRSLDLLVGAPKTGKVVAVYVETGAVLWGPVDIHNGLPAPYNNPADGITEQGSCTNGKVRYCTTDACQVPGT